MKNKGFTLIELLAVIVTLAIIFSIVSITVGGTIDNSESNLSKTQKNIIEHAAQTFYVKEGRNYDATCVNLSTLIDNGYLKADQVKDPKTKETMDGSVKITIEGNKYSYEYKDNACNMCSPVRTATTGNIPTGSFNYGDEYICDVGDGEDKTFFVLGTDGDNVNLIMNANVGIDGKAVTSTSPNKSTVAWVTKEDYIAAGGTESDWDKKCTNCGNDNKGPITVTKALKEYTSTWTNISPSQITLPTANQIAAASGQIFNNVSISDFQIWLYDYLSSNSSPYGYWITPSHAVTFNCAWIVNSHGSLSYDTIIYDSYYGVRPVITLSKSEIQ